MSLRNRAICTTLVTNGVVGGILTGAGCRDSLPLILVFAVIATAISIATYTGKTRSV